jgi:hypothetical protein
MSFAPKSNLTVVQPESESAQTPSFYKLVALLSPDALAKEASDHEPVI